MMETTRRGLLSGLAGLAALAVVPTTLLPLTETDLERFYRQAKSGYVPDITLMLRDTLRLSDMPRLHIGKLNLVAVGDWHGNFMSLSNVGPIHIGALICEDRRNGPAHHGWKVDIKTMTDAYARQHNLVMAV